MGVSEILPLPLAKKPKSFATKDKEDKLTKDSIFFKNVCTLELAVKIKLVVWSESLKR